MQFEKDWKGFMDEYMSLKGKLKGIVWEKLQIKLWKILNKLNFS